MDGERFKTGYVARPISYSELGRKAGERIGDSLRVMQQEKARAAAAMDQAMGFSKTGQEVVPGALNQRFRQGAQLLLDELQTAAAAAKLAPSGENLAAFQRAKQDYNEFKDMAVAVSSQNNQTVQQIRSGGVRGMVGTAEENLALFDEYNKVPEYSVVDGQLVVMEDGRPVAWRETTVGDISNVFIPQIQAPESEHTSDLLAGQIFDSKIAAEVDSYQIQNNEGYRTGELDLESLNMNITQSINNRLETRPDALKAIAYEAHKRHNLPMQDQLTTQDLDDALIAYKPEAHGLKVGEELISMGALDAEGNFVFNVSDEDLAGSNLSAEEKRSAMAWREAVSEYYEGVALQIRNRVPKKDESNIQRRNELSQRRQEENARRRTQGNLDAANEEARLEAQQEIQGMYDMAPGLRRTVVGGVDDAEYTMSVGNYGDYTVPGQNGNIVVTNVTYDERGNVIRYEVRDAGYEVGEIAMNPEMSPEEKAQAIQVAMAGQNSRIITRTDEDFAAVQGALENKDVSSTRIPPSDVDALAAEKIRAREEGRIGDNIVSSRGVGRVSFDEDGRAVIGATDDEVDLDEVYEQEVANAGQNP